MSSVLLYIKKMYILSPNASSFFLVADVIWPSSGTGCRFPFSLLLLLVGSLELKHEIAVVPRPCTSAHAALRRGPAAAVWGGHAAGHGAGLWRDHVSRKNT